ncbi:MAG: Stp1/IreP family PP2C-type Ser/Thr phosphatase [Candidatus Eisenbacteria bacterium]
MTKTEAEGLQLATLTDVGRRRSGNEDSHAVWVSEDAAEYARRGALLVVADGMGGANAGEVASHLAATTVVESYRADTGNDPAHALRIAIETANARVHAQSVANAEQRGMGTTCTAVVVRGTKLWIGHVGDSRAYLVRQGETHRLTSDHSLVAELVERGHLTEQEAKHDPRRNVVTRSVGALAEVQVDAGAVEEPLLPGDRIVICSDGLHGQVSDSEIAMLVGESEPDEACRGLIDLANERGGPDNITAIVARITGDVAASIAHDDAPAAKSATTTLILDPEPAPAPEPAKPAKPAKPGKGAKAAKSEQVSETPSTGVPGLPKLVLALVVLLALVAVVAMQVLKQVNKPADVAAQGEGAPAESAAPSEESSSGSEPAAPSEERASEPAPADKPAATPVTSAPLASEKPAAKPTRSPFGKPGAAAPAPAAAAPVAAATPAAAVVQTEVLIVTRPFQPALFQVDGQLHSQDVGSVLLRELSPGSHSAHVEDSRGRGVTMTFVVGDTPSKELVALLPGFDKVGDLDVVLKGAESARLYIDGAQYPRMAPCVVRGLAPGPHRIRAFNPKTRRTAEVTEADVRAGGSTRVEIEFTP